MKQGKPLQKQQKKKVFLLIKKNLKKEIPLKINKEGKDYINRMKKYAELTLMDVLDDVKNGKVIYAKEEILRRSMKEPTIEEISKEIGISKEDIIYALDAIQNPMSLYDPIYTDGGDTLYVMDQVSDKKNREENWIEHISLNEAIKRLGEREKEIITLRFFEGKTQMEVAGGDVADGGQNDQSDEAADQRPILEQDHVTQTANHAQTGTLSDGTDDQAGSQSSEQRSAHGAGAALRELQQHGESHQQDQQSHVDAGHGNTFQLALLVSTAQGEALLQEDDADQDTGDEAQQTDNGVQIAAGDTQSHTQGAAQEDQSAHHDAEAQHKTGQGRRTAAGGEVLLDQSDDKGANHQTDDLGTDVLDDSSTVHTDTAGDVTDEAGDAEAHVLGVAQHHQCNGDGTNDTAANQQISFFFHFSYLPKNEWIALI